MPAMNYKETLNLPKTDFPMKGNLPKAEPEILASWKKERLYTKLRTLRKGSPRFVLHDGPPYANGDIHMGHALNKILKDLIVKYKTMQGFDAPYLPGWDCHGMPIEHALFERLGKKKDEIDRVLFREKAKAFALDFVERQKGQFERLGVFGDWEHPYLTLDPKYEARVIHVFKELSLKEYIYRRKKPVYWCPSCETALAEAEVEYEEREDPSLFVKFKIPAPPFKKGAKEAFFFVIWTTTPWTLPANLAVALHPEKSYAVVKGKEENERWIMAAERLSAVSASLGLPADPEIVTTQEGERFVGTAYNRPFSKEEGKVLMSDFVSMEEGTGIVHIAPGHGEEDYFLGLRNQLPIFSPVDEEGRFNDEVPVPSLKGKKVFEANTDILRMLKTQKALLHENSVTHPYPHCWRCKQPILFRATEQWFLNVEKEDLRKRLLGATESVKWIPAFGKSRIQGMLKTRPDWCLSRQRYWGTPIPVVYCGQCHAPVQERPFFEKVERIIASEGTDAWFKRGLEDFLPKGFRCRCGGTIFQKEEDILDVWFDSGVSYEAVLKTHPELTYPASLYLEGSDQHRGWFQVSLIPAVANDGFAPYREVLTHGFVMDGEGLKMSKSRGNVVSPLEVLKTYGADILRLWVFSCQYGDDVRISDEILQRTAEAYRKIRNTFKYLLGNLYDFKEKDAVPYAKMLEVDRWALLVLGRLVQEATEAMDRYAFHRAHQAIYRFCVIDLSSFYLDLLKDRLYTFNSGSLERRSGQTALFHILEVLSRILAPVLSFTMEEVNRARPVSSENRDRAGGISSIHEARWPSCPAEWIDEALEERWETLLKLREGALKAIEAFRMAGKCGSSLEVAVHLLLNRKGTLDWLENYTETLAMLLIVSEVAVEPIEAVPSQKRIPELPDLGIEIRRAPGKKCSRCWNWRTTVGKDPDHPELCDRCASVVGALKL